MFEDMRLVCFSYEPNQVKSPIPGLNGELSHALACRSILLVAAQQHGFSACCIAGKSSNPQPDEMIPRFPFSIVKPRPSTRSDHGAVDHVQPSQTSAKLPLGAVAVAASQAVPAATSPSIDAHAQAALHPAPESIAAQKAAARQSSVTQRQTLGLEDTGKHASPATASQQPACTHKAQPLVSLRQDDSGTKPAQVRAADAAGDSQHQLQSAVASEPSQILDVSTAQQGHDVPALGWSGKRLHDAMGQDVNDAVQAKDQVENVGSDEPPAKKLNLM